VGHGIPPALDQFLDRGIEDVTPGPDHPRVDGREGRGRIGGRHTATVAVSWNDRLLLDRLST
jgi:hypothetical protein